MYTGQQIRVLWQGVFSEVFLVSNGVKQGAVISPVLFCVYFDSLLVRLRKTAVGCYLDKWFIGALAYADDIALLAPSANAMRKLLAVCESFANEYSVVFNVNKSKYVKFDGRKGASRHTNNAEFYLCNSAIENVDNWMHLGHMLRADLDDADDIQLRRGSMIAQTNKILCCFANTDSVVKDRLFKAYCTSYYGCELWDMGNNKMEDFCKTWRKGLRKVWNIPANSHCDLVYLISDTSPIFDEICRRVHNFIFKCLTCKSDLVRDIADFGLHNLSNSPIGRNAIFCRLKFHGLNSIMFNAKLSVRSVQSQFSRNLSNDSLCTARVIKELILIREGRLVLNVNCFNWYELQFLIGSLCVGE